MFSRTFASCVAALVLATAGTARAAVPAAGQTWLVASDIHLDPYARGSDPALVGSDANRALLRETIARMRSAVPDPAVVLLPGDFLAHDFEHLGKRSKPADAAAAALATMRDVATAFDRAFPRARFAIALGNNDAPCGDYRTALGGAYAAQLARIWAPLVNRGGAAPQFERSFAATGTYAMQPPGSALRVVAFDDVPLAFVYRGACAGSAGTDAGRVLDALANELAAAPAGTRNAVLMHLPPGYDSFSTELLHGYAVWPFLSGGPAGRLLGLLTAPENRVAYAFAGHVHRFDFRLDGGVPVLVFGSVSPVYHNNPAFYALHVGRDGTIADIDAYAYDEWMQEWQSARSFDRKTGSPRVDAAALRALHERLGSDASARSAWQALSNGWPSNPEISWKTWDGGRWRIPWCAQTVLNDGVAFAQCAELERRVTLGIAAVAMAALTAIAAAVLLVVLLRRLFARARR